MSCGLCLPHCPTFRVTGEEGLSPRGRIDAMRSVQWRGAPVDASVVRYVETCVQCRGCEPACPSGVPFGHLMEQTKAALAAGAPVTPRWQRAAFRVLGHHRALLAGSTVLAVAQRLRLVPKRLGLGRLPLRRGPRAGADPFGGRSRRLAVHRVRDGRVDATDAPQHRRPDRGGRARPSPCRRAGAACCGALHVHAGLQSEAQAPGGPDDRGDAGRRSRARELGRVRCGDEGLRAPARHRRRGRASRPGCATSTSGSPSGSTSCRRPRTGRGRR